MIVGLYIIVIFLHFLIPFVLESFCKTKQQAAIINSKKGVFGQWYSFDSEWMSIQGKRLFF
jgi:hypothetical protein